MGKVHPSISPERIADAIQESHTTLANPGFCIACGADADGCEPDARGYACDECDAHAVYGAEELLFMVGA